MSQMQTFGFGPLDVRVIEQEGQPWFVAGDVCECLGLKADGQNRSYQNHYRCLALDELSLGCAFHAIRPPSPPTSGHLFHAHPAGQSERSDAGLHC